MSVLGAIGNTPLVELTRLNSRRPTVRIFAKLEGNNPGGSVKDRPAWWMIKAAEDSGQLTPGRTILEATSGNTGIAMAMIGAARGYRVALCISAGASLERRRVLEALGATVILTPAHERTDGAIRKAHQLSAESPAVYYMPNQFENPSNTLAHYESTGPEILAQTEGKVDVFVAGMGTTGTLMGVSRCLKEWRPGVRIVGVEPPIGHRIQGLKNMREAIQPKIYNPAMLDERITVVDEEAFDATRRLATEEGIFAGMSSGAAVAAALRIAKRMTRGTIVALLPDRGDRYLSTNLFQPAYGQREPKVA
jgi:S-sulfo-L-cysteine synthase (O-acetyl-L-serine-dependent)